ncbi:hypothetical protein NQZ68_002439 [Dissostichus eleginoides]|nr:hypothetical protein NQZ68_002439 [Dissostichus eleginoides]
MTEGHAVRDWAATTKLLHSDGPHEVNNDTRPGRWIENVTVWNGAKVNIFFYMQMAACSILTTLLNGYIYTIPVMETKSG